MLKTQRNAVLNQNTYLWYVNKIKKLLINIFKNLQSNLLRFLFITSDHLKNSTLWQLRKMAFLWKVLEAIINSITTTNWSNRFTQTVKAKKNFLLNSIRRIKTMLCNLTIWPLSTDLFNFEKKTKIKKSKNQKKAKRNKKYCIPNTKSS